MKTLKIAALALVGMMAVAGAANAQCYVGGMAGGSMANMGLSDATNALGLPGGSFGVDGLGARSSRPDFGGTVGCDVNLGASPLFVGLAATIVSQDVSFDVNPGLLSASLGNSWGAALRGGYRFESGTKAFGKVGWTQTDLNIGGLLAPALAGADIPSRLNGWTFGGGMETPLKGTPLVMGLEVDWTRYNSEAIAGGLVDLKTDQLKGMLTLKYVFGGSTVLPVPMK